MVDTLWAREWCRHPHPAALCWHRNRRSQPCRPHNFQDRGPVHEHPVPLVFHQHHAVGNGRLGATGRFTPAAPASQSAHSHRCSQLWMRRLNEQALSILVMTIKLDLPLDVPRLKHYLATKELNEESLESTGVVQVRTMSAPIQLQVAYSCLQLLTAAYSCLQLQVAYSHHCQPTLQTRKVAWREKDASLWEGLAPPTVSPTDLQLQREGNDCAVRSQSATFLCARSWICWCSGGADLRGAERFPAELQLDFRQEEELRAPGRETAALLFRRSAAARGDAGGHQGVRQLCCSVHGRRFK